tara:strand:- start:2246 stop:3847 length:1602 start_codon:yes stop_codon:yes gene_type:complete
MIKRLYVKNFAIIDEIDLVFKPGLTVITGETGSGKSILIEALSIALGSKGDRIMVRNGKERALIEVEFKNTKFRRIISSKGRTKSYKNDEVISLIDLKKENKIRVDFHGQHDQQFILDKNTHLDYLDRYCGHTEDVFQLRKIYSELVDLRQQFEKLKNDKLQLTERLSLLNYQLDEINLIAPAIGEDIEVKNQYRKQNNIQEILKSLKNIRSEIYQNDHNVTDKLSFILNQLSKIEKYDSNTLKIKDLISDAILNIEESRLEIDEQLNGLEYDRENLIAVEERMNDLESLKRKYGGSIESVLDEKIRIQKEISNLSSIEKNEEKIKNAIVIKETEFSNKAIKVHEKRNSKSNELAKFIESKMSDLNMDGTKFKISLDSEENNEGFVRINNKIFKAFEQGIDFAEFYLSANPGEPLKPLTLVASGGEMSRIMLAIKTVFQDIDPVETLIFDEIDSGISGKAAEKVSDHLLNLSQKKQVFCITHLSQIVNKANHHLHIEKHIDNNKTYVKINYLNKIESLQTIKELFYSKEILNS